MNMSEPGYYLSVAEALEAIGSQFKPIGKESVDLLEALDRFIAEDIVSTTDSPAFANSSMDGFGVISTDVAYADPEKPVILKIIDDIPAGKYPTKEVKKGTAVRIMTGAVLPPGANAVVPLEHTNQQTWNNSEEIPEFVEIYKPSRTGEYIRQIGEDIPKGKIVLKAGSRIRARDLGILSFLGKNQVLVYKKPCIAVGSSGDELVMPGISLLPGKIYDSNSYMLRGLVVKFGGVAFDLGVIRDERESVLNALENAVKNNVELIVTTGGVSVGAYDFIKMVMEENGNLNFWKVNMRPGKPIAFGNYGKIPFLGLPGNPVSAYVGFLLFVRTAMIKLTGSGQPLMKTQRVIMEDDIQSDGRESYLRGIVTQRNQEYYARLTGHQGSGNLLSLVDANTLLIVPSEVKSVRSGEELEAWIIDEID